VLIVGWVAFSMGQAGNDAAPSETAATSTPSADTLCRHTGWRRNSRRCFSFTRNDAVQPNDSSARDQSLDIPGCQSGQRDSSVSHRRFDNSDSHSDDNTCHA
jgi:hypothetical protein